MQLVIHAPFGGRINKAWGLALRKRFCRSFNFELQAAATDDGINIALAEQHSFPLGDVFGFLSTATVQEVLEQAVLDSPIFGTRWRWDASRSLALLRFRGGKKVPLQIQRMQSDDLLASVFPDAAACQENIDGDIQIPDHPLVREVMKDVLTEAMDSTGSRTCSSGIADGRIQMRRRGHAGAVGLLARDPERESVRVSSTMRRSKSGGRARSRCAAMLPEVGARPRSARSIRRRSTRCVQRGLAGRPRRRRAARRAADAHRAAGSGAVPDARWRRDDADGRWTELFDQLVAERRAGRAIVGGPHVLGRGRASQVVLGALPGRAFRHAMLPRSGDAAAPRRGARPWCRAG